MAAIRAACGSKAVAMADGIMTAALERLLVAPYVPTVLRLLNTLRATTSALNQIMKNAVCMTIGATKRSTGTTPLRSTWTNDGLIQKVPHRWTIAIAAQIDQTASRARRRTVWPHSSSA